MYPPEAYAIVNALLPFLPEGVRDMLSRTLPS